MTQKWKDSVVLSISDKIAAESVHSAVEHVQTYAALCPAVGELQISSALYHRCQKNISSRGLHAFQLLLAVRNLQGVLFATRTPT